MATGVEPDLRRESFTSLASGIVDDVEEMFKAELKLARYEIRNDLANAKEAAALGGVAMVSLLVGAFVTAVAAAQFIAWLGMPLWAGSLIVGALCLLTGAAFGVAAKSKSKHLGPEQTVQSVKENVRWIKEHV